MWKQQGIGVISPSRDHNCFWCPGSYWCTWHALTPAPFPVCYVQLPILPHSCSYYLSPLGLDSDNTLHKKSSPLRPPFPTSIYPTIQRRVKLSPSLSSRMPWTILLQPSGLLCSIPQEWSYSISPRDQSTWAVTCVCQTVAVVLNKLENQSKCK